jgi:hypothetical protein
MKQRESDVGCYCSAVTVQIDFLVTRAAVPMGHCFESQGFYGRGGREAVSGARASAFATLQLVE